ncbi:MAG: DUF3794 domain-containing protein, partial [Oscillospiraceae bacterium]
MPKIGEGINMTTPLFFDSVTSTTKVLETAYEHSIETELLLADYDAPVFKIIKTTMEHSVSQKYVSQGKLTVEGFIKLCVYYQPPESEKLSVVSQKIAFQKQLEVANFDAEVNFISVSGQTQYVNTRAQNPTRIDIRGAYLFNFKVYSRLENRLITAIKSPTICTDDTTIDFFSLAGQNMRQFTLEDEISLDEGAQKILRVETKTSEASIAVYQDKLTVKGEIDADIFYNQENGFDIKKLSKIFLYNQIIDIPNMKENYIPFADIYVSSFAIAQNQDSKKLVANVTAQIDAKVFSKQQVIAVRDAFSRSFECEKQSESFLIDSNIYSVNKVAPFMLEDKFSKEYTVSDVIFEIGQPRSYFEINKTTVKAKLAAHVIARNVQNEYECFTKTDDIYLDWLEGCSQYDEIFLGLSLADFEVLQSDDLLKIKVNLCAQGFVMEKQKLEILHNLVESAEKPLPPTEEALILYYGQKGESIFDI